MKKYFYVIALFAIAFAIAGCSTTKEKFDNRKTRMVEGTGVGAVVGGVTGGLIGHQAGNTAAGALIGGAVGGAGGAAVGSQINRNTQDSK